MVEPESQFSIGELFRMAWLKRKVLACVSLLSFALVVLYCVFAPRMYNSTAVVQVLTQGQNGLSGESSLSTTSAPGDAMSAPLIDKTQATILTSERFIATTIRQLDLIHHWKLEGKNTATHPEAAMSAATKNLRNNLSVAPITGTRLISIGYRDRNPQLAAAVVNNLIHQLVTYSFDSQSESFKSSSGLLGEQLAQLRQQSEQAEAKAVALQQKLGLFGVSVGEKGGDPNYSGTIDELQQATQLVNQAQQNRILKGAIVQIADTGDAEMLSGLGGNALAGSSVTGSLDLLQHLREQQATLRAEIAQMSTKYDVAFPLLVEDKRKLQSLQDATAQETDRLKRRAQGDYQIAQANEKAALGRYDQAKTNAAASTTLATDYAIAREDATRTRSLYEDLSRRANEAGVGAELRTTNISVVDPGQVPNQPESPRVKVLLAIGFCSSLLLGFIAALLAKSMDGTILSPADWAGVAGRRLDVQLPFSSAVEADGMQAAPSQREHDPLLASTTLALSTILIPQGAPASPSIFLICSLNPDEGKAVLTTLLARAFSSRGLRVLMVDADLGGQGLSKALGKADVGNSGLAELLESGRQPTMGGLPESMIDFISSGHSSDPMHGCLASEAMLQTMAEWRQKYEVILMYAPALSKTRDALTLTGLADRNVFVLRSQRTQAKAAWEAVRDIKEQRGDQSIVTVLNFVPRGAFSYGI